MMNQKRMRMSLGVAIALAIAMAAALGLFKSRPAEEPVFCTQDAMECPDGSYVGRIGPDCRFAPCPGI